jgi:hypothetical protein
MVLVRNGEMHTISVNQLIYYRPDNAVYIIKDCESALKTALKKSNKPKSSLILFNGRWHSAKNVEFDFSIADFKTLSLLQCNNDYVLAPTWINTDETIHDIIGTIESTWLAPKKKSKYVFKLVMKTIFKVENYGIKIEEIRSIKMVCSEVKYFSKLSCWSRDNTSISTDTKNLSGTYEDFLLAIKDLVEEEYNYRNFFHNILNTKYAINSKLLGFFGILLMNAIPLNDLLKDLNNE